MTLEKTANQQTRGHCCHNYICEKSTGGIVHTTPISLHLKGKQATVLMGASYTTPSRPRPHRPSSGMWVLPHQSAYLCGLISEHSLLSTFLGTIVVPDYSTMNLHVL